MSELKTSLIKPHYLNLHLLNAKSELLACKSNNKNGEILEEIILNTNLIIINNKQPTYHRLHDNSTEILDWFLISDNMHDKLLEFKVLENSPLNSDHYPIQVKLNLNDNDLTCNDTTQVLNNNNIKPRYNFNKADWDGFQNSLQNTTINTNKRDIDELNNEITNAIPGCEVLI
jgi:hypothetical protein